MERPNPVLQGTAFLGAPPTRKPTRAQLRRNQVETDRDSDPATVSLRPVNLLPDPFKSRPISVRDQLLWAPLLSPESFAASVTAQDFDSDGAIETRGKSRGRELLAHLPLHEVALWFEKTRLDFLAVGGAKLSDAKIPAFVVNFLDERDPGNVDIKAGSFVVEKNPKADALHIAQAVRGRSRVALWRFRCAGYDGHCKCGRNKAEGMKLFVEIFAHDITKAYISVDNFHDALPKTANSKLLAPSSILKLEAWKFFMHDSKSRVFLKAYDTAIQKSGRPMSEKTLRAIARKARRFKLGPASVDVLSSLAQKDPYVFASRLKSRSNDKNKLGGSFAFMMTDPIGLVDGIRFGMLVSGIDVAFRNFSTSNVPLTVLVSFDHVSHQIRLLALLFSADTTEETLGSFVAWYQGQIQQFCAKLKDERDSTAGGVSNWPAELRGLAERVVALAEGKLWEPDVFTTDHAENQYNVIRKTCPSSKIRACFFHFVQQILRWSFTVDPSEEAADRNPCESVRKGLVASLSELFQVSRSDMATAEAAFLETGIAQCVDRGSPNLSATNRLTLVGAIKDRLNRVWFNDRWRQTIYSHHLPDHVANSDVWTNNWAEGTIRSLRSYLGGRCNIVACILQLRRYWSYYRTLDGDPRCNSEQSSAMAHGGALWVLRRVAAADESDTRFHVARDDENAPSALVDLGVPRNHCDVPACRLRPQFLCKHFFAADLFAHNGPYQGRVQRLGSAVEVNDLGQDGSELVDRVRADDEGSAEEEDDNEHDDQVAGGRIETDSDSDNENLDPRINLTTNLPGRPATSKATLEPIRPQSRVPPRPKPPPAVILPEEPLQIKYTLNAATRHLNSEGATWPMKKKGTKRASSATATSRSKKRRT